MALMPAALMAVEAEIDGLWYDLVSKAKEAKVIKYKDTKYSGDIVIPAEVEYEGVAYSVTSIGNYAFSGCTSLTSITIPSSVTSIEGIAFNGCTSLTSVTIPSSVTSIGSSAFRNCTSLTSVTIPSSVTSIESVAFYGCTGLTTITIPSSVTSIESYAFYGCTGLTSVTIPSSVTTIGDDAFFGCTSLTSVTIPSSVTSIGRYAFYGCTGLTSVTIPSSVTSIRESAFKGCTGLTSVTIPSSVTYIGESAFKGCTELKDVYCYAEKALRTYSSLFEGSYIEYSTLHVPASAIESYRTTAPWSGFGKIVALDGEEPVVPEPEQCATPTIYYNSGKLSFKSETEGATFVSEIKDADVKKFYDSEIALGVTYNISVYATRDGYKDSEVATATLCWIDVEPQKEGISDDEVVSVKEMKAQPVLIQRSGNGISVTGAPAGTPIAVYDLRGQLLGCATATAETTRVQALNSEKVVVVKIGERAVKVAK